ncbi:unnamed protein product [Musa acuminata subsp. malaccensis]|nr:unnamed protein product [Musa acuminata subsp. malaccensis]
MPPPPAKWKGRCDLKASACNNKLIGARSFINHDGRDRRSTGTPVDEEGHGTHTSSTAAGAFVKRANVNGFAPGVAAGMAPRAHIAAYKVCDEIACMGHDMLAAMDAAVDDGVDVLSFSISADPIPFHSDPIAQGTFNAIGKGVFISCSAGNEGPDPGSVNNDAPWVLTVGASTTDRLFLASVKLGNGRKLYGESLHRPRSFNPKMLPLVYPGFVTAKDGAYMCINGTLDGVDVRGKLVLCQLGVIDSVQMSEVVKKAGGAGMIVMNYPVDGYTIIADDHVLPTSMVPYAYGLEIQAYINSTSTPIANIIYHAKEVSNWEAKVEAQGVKKYKALRDFKKGLARLRHNSLAFGYDLAMSRAKYDHPDIELPENPIDKRPTNDEVMISSSDIVD